jgi:hypothetical protein
VAWDLGGGRTWAAAAVPGRWRQDLGGGAGPRRRRWMGSRGDVGLQRQQPWSWAAAGGIGGRQKRRPATARSVRVGDDSCVVFSDIVSILHCCGAMQYNTMMGYGSGTFNTWNKYDLYTRTIVWTRGMCQLEAWVGVAPGAPMQFSLFT